MQNATNIGREGHGVLIARIAVATTAILWVLHGQDWRELTRVFQNLNVGRFAVGLVLYASAQIIISVRWWLLLRAQSIGIDVRTTVQLFFLGLFYNNFLPGLVSGDLVKAWYVMKHTKRRLEGVLSVFVDRVVGLAGLVLMAIVTYMLFVRGHIEAGSTPREAAGPRAWLSQHREAILWGSLALALVFTGMIAHPTGRARLAHGAEILRCKGVSLLRRTKDAVVVYCSRPWMLLGVVALTFAAQAISVIALWLVGRDLEVEAALRYYLVIFPVIWVVGAVPISIAGLGILEGGTVVLFVSLTGATAEKALALAFCQRFIWVLASLPGGVVHLLGMHLPEQDIQGDRI